MNQLVMVGVVYLIMIYFIIIVQKMGVMKQMII